MHETVAGPARINLVVQKFGQRSRFHPQHGLVPGDDAILGQRYGNAQAGAG